MLKKKCRRYQKAYKNFQIQLKKNNNYIKEKITLY